MFLCLVVSICSVHNLPVLTVWYILPWIIEHGELDCMEMHIYGIECRFRIKYAITSCYSGLSGVKVAALGMHQFKIDLMT